MPRITGNTGDYRDVMSGRLNLACPERGDYRVPKLTIAPRRLGFRVPPFNMRFPLCLRVAQSSTLEEKEDEILRSLSESR